MDLRRDDHLRKRNRWRNLREDHRRMDLREDHRWTDLREDHRRMNLREDRDLREESRAGLLRAGSSCRCDQVRRHELRTELRRREDQREEDRMNLRRRENRMNLQRRRKDRMNLQRRRELKRWRERRYLEDRRWAAPERRGRKQGERKRGEHRIDRRKLRKDRSDRWKHAESSFLQEGADYRLQSRFTLLAPFATGRMCTYPEAFSSSDSSFARIDSIRSRISPRSRLS